MNIETWPNFSKSEIEAATNVLSSGKVNYWTGEQTKLFEKEFSKWCGVNYSIGLANGSLALSCIYKAIGLGKGDEFITTPRSFIATASEGALLGAKPIFVDVDPDSGAITDKTIETRISKKTKAISVVHLGGWPADMPAICRLAREHNIKIIEDCSQAHGAFINFNGTRKSVGSFGDAAAWSFCQDKIISTGGEGGMASTNNESIWQRIWEYKDHGKSFRRVNEKNPKAGYRWLHETFGTNNRLTEFQSSIGRIQLSCLSQWTKKREKNAKILINYLSKIPEIRIPIPPDSLTHAWYKFYCYLDEKYLCSDWSRDRIISEIVSLGYPAYHGSCSEIYLEKCFKKFYLQKPEFLPVAKNLGQTSLMFLVHPTITEEKMKAYAEAISIVIKRAIN